MTLLTNSNCRILPFPLQFYYTKMSSLTCYLIDNLKLLTICKYIYNNILLKCVMPQIINKIL